MSDEQSEYVGGLLLIGFMHRLYEEYVDSSVLWLLLKKKKTDRPIIDSNSRIVSFTPSAEVTLPKSTCIE